MTSDTAPRVQRFAEQAQALLGTSPRPRATESSGGPWCLIFVCTGNICRSPFAEQTLGALMRESPLMGKVALLSAGTGALTGHEMDTQAAAIYAKRFGTPPRPHRAQRLTGTLAARGDLLLVMDSGQRRTVLRNFPQAFPRTFLLSEYVAICRNLDVGIHPSSDPNSSTTASRLSALTHRAAQHRSLGATAPDIADPYRRSVEIHEQVASQIHALVGSLMSILISASGLAD